MLKRSSILTYHHQPLLTWVDLEPLLDNETHDNSLLVFSLFVRRIVRDLIF
jgi:hypothetical protein